jgi:ABC-type sugar transport system permease subunit
MAPDFTQPAGMARRKYSVIVPVAVVILIKIGVVILRSESLSFTNHRNRGLQKYILTDMVGEIV